MNDCEKRKRNSSGISMIEVIIALVIASIVTSFIAMGVIGTSRINSNSRDMRNAATFAEEKIEDLRRLSFGSIDSGSDEIDGFRRVWDVTEISTQPRIKTIEMKISWEDSKDRTHIVTYNTTFYKNAYPYK